MVAAAEERVVPDEVVGRRRRAAFFLALPLLVVVIGIGFVPLALVAIWSLWSFDPDIYWIKPVLCFSSYLLGCAAEKRASRRTSPNTRLGRIDSDGVDAFRRSCRDRHQSLERA